MLVTTSTLAAGVNTPADVVILLDYKRFDPGLRTSVSIPVGEYKNSVGRAGRFGIASEGHSYLIVDDPNEARLVEANYLFGQSPQIRSSMPGISEPAALVLELLSLGLVANQDDLRMSLRHSFAFNYYFHNDSDKDHFLTEFLASLGELEDNSLAQRESDRLTITALGTAASSSGMSLDSFYQLVTAVKCIGRDGGHVSDLMPLLCQLREFQSLRPFDNDKRVQMLNEWIAGSPMYQIIEKYSGRYELGSGHVRAIGERAAWMLNTAARIASIPGNVLESEAISKTLAELAQRCKFGVPSEIVALAELRILQRSELNLLVDNSTNKILDTPHRILDAGLDDFVGILSPRRAERLQAAILDHIGESVSSRRFGHATRANRFGGLRPLVERCYDLEGTELEIALQELLNTQYAQVKANRFARQRNGQPDLEIVGLQGTVVVQITASEDNKKPVNWAKAKEVVSSVGYSERASNYVTVARPEFHDVAIGNANEMAERGDQKLLLIPLPELIEVFLSEVEGRVPEGTLLRVLEGARGHFVMEEWRDSLQVTQSQAGQLEDTSRECD